MCTIWPLSGFPISSVALRLMSLSQPDGLLAQQMSFGVVGVTFVIRAARGGQGGKLGLAGSLRLWFAGSQPCPVGMSAGPSKPWPTTSSH